MKRPLALVILMMLFPAAVPAAAQQPPPQPTEQLPPVVVEGTRAPNERTEPESEAREELRRVPGGVDLIGEQQIKESRAANLKDVLDFTPGVWIRPRAGAADESQISIRGSGLRSNFHLRGVNILLDGYPYGNADGFSDFESLELLDTKRIEVYKGANSLRFGGFALGGAINLITKTGYDAGLVEMRSEAGSFGFLKNHLATGQVYGPLDIYLGLTDVELQGYREHSAQHRERIYNSWGWDLGGGASVRLDLNYVKNREQLPGALTQQELDRTPRAADPSNLALRLRAARNYDWGRGAVTVRLPLTDTQAFEWSTQLSYQDLHHPLSFAVIDDTTWSYSTELRWILAAPVFDRGNRLTAGLQYFGTRQIDVNFTNVVGTPPAKTKNQINVADAVALYVENQLDVTPAFTAIIGGRGQYSIRAVRDRMIGNDGPGDLDGNDSDSVDFLDFSPRVGFVWRPAPAVQVFGNVSRTYEPPLLLELTAPGQLQGTLSQLAAQKAWQFELGTRGAWARRLTWELSIYDIELDDEIQNVNVQPFPGAPFTIPRFRNIDRTRHTGLEAAGELLIAQDLARRVGLGAAGDALRLHAAYTFSRFVFVDDVNFGSNHLPGVPPHFMRAEVRYDHQSGFWAAPYVEVVPQSYFVNSQNDARARSYTTMGTRLGYTYAPWQLTAFFEGRNLNNVVYTSSVVVDDANRRFFEPADGRAFYGGLEWRFR
jgi:iron complex outermembrane recepter protein